MADFGAQVTAWARKSQNRVEAVFKESAQDLFEEALTPKAKGGRLPVQTSFLRNSAGAVLNSIPSGQGQKPPGYSATDFDFSPIVLVINKAKIGDRIVMGFLAQYAPYVEANNAFVRSAAQNWNKIVFRAAKRVEKEVTR